MLDENGAPVANASVTVNYRPRTTESNPPLKCTPVPDSGFCWLTALTNETGHYAVEFDPKPWPQYGLGYIEVSRDGYETNVQWVPRASPPTIQNVKLRTSRTILAGASITVTVDPTSSLCTDFEDLWVFGDRCEIVNIEAGPGALLVEARAVSGNVVPLMYWYTSSNTTARPTIPAPGSLSIPAGGGLYRVLIGLPDGALAQRFNVTTSLQ